MTVVNAAFPYGCQKATNGAITFNLENHNVYKANSGSTPICAHSGAISSAERQLARMNHYVTQTNAENARIKSVLNSWWCQMDCPRDGPQWARNGLPSPDPSSVCAPEISCGTRRCENSEIQRSKVFKTIDYSHSAVWNAAPGSAKTTINSMPQLPAPCPPPAPSPTTRAIAGRGGTPASSAQSGPSPTTRCIPGRGC
jgi:hypothetical protein